MTLNIEENNSFGNTVKAYSIHGKFPYKAYLEILGNSTVGQYIVVVSNKPITTAGNKIENIVISRKHKSSIGAAVKLNTVSNGGYNLSYKVKEISILDVKDKQLRLFNLKSVS